MLDVIIKRFEAPDEVRVFEKGKFEIVRLGGMTIGHEALRSSLLFRRRFVARVSIRGRPPY